ncbi:hypothetical protein T05_1910, partial [Trichinella murrelli]
LLIGIDHYYDIVLNEIKRVDTSKPTAVKTIFGWVICGKNIPQHRTHLLHCKVNEECKCECNIIKKFCEIEAKINARPLTFVGDDVKDADALTPFHFLIRRSFVDLPMMSTPTVDKEELPLNRKWRKRQQIILHFWKRWRNVYVTTFVSRSKWMTKRQEPKEGDIVLVKEDNAKRKSWPIGRITSVLPGSDGLCRTVEVKTAKGTFTRPVARLYLLEPASTR